MFLPATPPYISVTSFNCVLFPADDSAVHVIHAAMQQLQLDSGDGVRFVPKLPYHLDYLHIFPGDGYVAVCVCVCVCGGGGGGRGRLKATVDFTCVL